MYRNNEKGRGTRVHLVSDYINNGPKSKDATEKEIKCMEKANEMTLKALNTKIESNYKKNKRGDFPSFIHLNNYQNNPGYKLPVYLCHQNHSLNHIKNQLSRLFVLVLYQV